MAAPLLLGVPCLVQTKPLRLMQLRLVTRHLQQHAIALATAATASGTAGATASAAGSAGVATTCGQAGLLVQLLLAHLPSVGHAPEAAEQLLSLCGELLQLSQAAAAAATSATSTASTTIPGTVASGGAQRGEGQRAQRWCAALEAALSHSTHAALRAQLQPLLLPCASTLIHTLERQLPTPFSDSATAPSTAPLRPSELLGPHGRVWLLLGSLRLQLAAPPRGVDPAGKYLLQARHLQKHMAEVRRQPGLLVQCCLNTVCMCVVPCAFVLCSLSRHLAGTYCITSNAEREAGCTCTVRHSPFLTLDSMATMCRAPMWRWLCVRRWRCCPAAPTRARSCACSPPTAAGPRTRCARLGTR